MTKQLASQIPARWRARIYAVLGTLFTVESTLDLFDYGAVPAKPQAAAIAVCAALGFRLAHANTTDVTVVSG